MPTIKKAPVAPAAPALLRALPAWLLWRREVRTDRVLKMPYYANGKRRQGGQGAPEDRRQLVTFDSALTVLRRGGYDGLGLAFLPGFGITGLDFDKCVDEAGTVDQAVLDVIGDTYAELSPSGTGVHAIYLGEDLPNRKSRAQAGRWGFEVFTTAGFLTWTGRVLPGWDVLGLDTAVAPVSDAVRGLYQARFGAEVIERAASVAAGEDVVPAERVGLPVEDAERLLAALDPDCGYDEWIRVGMGLHHEYGARGLDLWDTWSSKGAKYPGPQALIGHWTSFGKAVGSRQPVTIRSLQKMAGPLAARADEFPVIAPGPSERMPLPAFARNKAGEILPTITNVVAALEREDVCGARVFFDEFRHCDMIDLGDGPRPVKDTDITELRIRLERIGFKNPGRELVRDAYHKAAEARTVDSAIEWAGGLRWDGVERVRRFCADYLKTADDEYAAAVSLYWWTAHAGRLLKPGIKADMVPVLVGPQGCGKTRAVTAIAPAPDLCAAINLAHRDENLSRAVRGKVVGELGELRGLATREAEWIKAWITLTHETWTPKYQEFQTSFPRRLVFVGTTNSDEFLADDTGERRWLPIDVAVTARQVDVEAIERDREQLWAEAIHLFEAGGIQYVAAQRLAVPRHEAYKTEDEWMGPIIAWLTDDEMDQSGTGAGRPRWRAWDERGGLSVGTVLRAAIGMDTARIDRRAQMRAASVLKRLGYAKKRTSTVSLWVTSEKTQIALTRAV